jgi:hypothetical protein
MSRSEKSARQCKPLAQLNWNQHIKMAEATRFVHTSFCDDVRHEQGNKLSLMGIYQGSLVIPGEAPWTLQKLCVVIEAHTPISDPFSGLTLQLRKDDKVINELVVPEDAYAQLKQPAALGVDLQLSMIGTIFVVQSLPIEKACMLSVIAKTEREELLGGRLHILVGDTVPKPTI